MTRLIIRCLIAGLWVTAVVANAVAKARGR